MKWRSIISKFTQLDMKIKIISIIFVVAILFFTLPEYNKPNTKSDNLSNDIQTLKNTTEKNLSEKLSKIVGVTKAEVIITYEDDGVIEYVTEDKKTEKADSEEGKKTSVQTQVEKKPVISGDKNIIIKSRKAPAIKGVCVFYSGGSDGLTVERLYSAVKGSLGVELHKIEVVLVK